MGARAQARLKGKASSKKASAGPQEAGGAKAAGKAAAQNPPRSHRVIATNVPFDADDKELQDFFPGAHSIQRHVKNGAPTGAVFVQCADAGDVEKFIKTRNKKRLKGRVVEVGYLKDKRTYLKEKEEKGAKAEAGKDGGKKEAEGEPAAGTKKAKRKEGELSENERGFKRRKSYEEEQKKPIKEGEEDRTAFVTNLSYKDSEEQIARKFKKYGDIEQCTVVRNKETGESAGRAFVLFKSAEHCKAAVKDEVILNNRVLTVLKYASPEALRAKAEEKSAKELKRKKKIDDRKKGAIEPMDPGQRSECRVYLSHIGKQHSRKTLAKAIKEFFEKSGKSVKFRGINLAADARKRNPGYSFVTFKHPEDASFFVRNYTRASKAVGAGSRAEFAMESKSFQEKGFKSKKSARPRSSPSE